MCAIIVNDRAGISDWVRDPGSSFKGLSPALFHSRLPGYRRAPLEESAGAAAALGAYRVSVKDESDRFGLPSFKVLGASFAVYNELKNVCGFEDGDWNDVDGLRRICRDCLPRSLVTATDGNHGRGVARTAAWLGIGAEVFVPFGTVRSRIEGIKSEGAQVKVVSGDYDAAVEEARSRAGGDRWLIQDTAWPGYERVPRLIVEGYSTIMEETDAQLAARGGQCPDVVAVQIGVGSLAAAVTGHLRAGGGKRPPVIVGVEPEGAACAFESISAGESVSVPGPHRSVMAGLNCGTLSSLAWPVIRDGIDIFVTVADEAAFESMRILAIDGIVSGESGAAGLAGLLSLLRDPEGRRAIERLGVRSGFEALVISTEGITDPELYRRVARGG